MQSELRYFKERFGVVSIIVALIIAGGCILIPLYHEYIVEERKETCYRARAMICIDYQKEMKVHPDWSEKEQLNCLASISEKLYSQEVTYTETGCIEVPNVCRSGGNYTIHVEDNGRTIVSTCDAVGHDACIWQ